MTVDQRGSRLGPDLVPQALSALGTILAGALKPALPFERTAGDEIQGVLETPQAVYAATRTLLRHRNWYVGIGSGPIDLPLPGRAAEGGGPAYWAARDAVNLAKTKRAHSPVAFVPHTPGPHDQEINGILQLLGFVLANRSERAWEALDLVTTSAGEGNAMSQQKAAAILGITPAALSGRLATAGLNQELMARPLVMRLLSDANSPAHTVHSAIG